MSGSDDSRPNRQNSPVTFNFDADEFKPHVDFMLKVKDAINSSDAAWGAYFSLVHTISSGKPESEITKKRIALTNALEATGMVPADAQKATKIIVDNAKDNLKAGGHDGP